MVRPLGIGVTGGVLEDRSLTARLQNDLTQAAVDPRRIVLQVRETAGVNLARARASAVGLRRLGVGIALDGFGGRDGALADLRELPFTQLRVDPSFTDATHAGALDDTVLAYAVTVGREFDRAVVATGIETPADAQRARAFGVGWGEGGLFGSPQPLTAQLAVPRPESLL